MFIIVLGQHVSTLIDINIQLYEYIMMYQSNKTELYYVYIVLGQHVSIHIESSSGPSKIQILT